MPDTATSSDPHVQRQLERLIALSPGADILGLERIIALLARVGDPQLRLPPVLHVAGTNGKGSTCAFLRAGLEAAGYRVHAYTSPHLVRFNERIRLGGTLIDDAALAPLLAEVLDAGGDIGASFFEVTTAAAFLAFARTPGDACIVEVGLGGRLDATNVIADPAVTGIAQLGVDHERFLGADPVGIAREKAGIAKPGRPLVTLAYPPPITAAIAAHAGAVGAPLHRAGAEWRYRSTRHALHYADAQGALELPLPTLPGAHQHANLALAVAMLRHQHRVAVPPAALSAAPRGARWPARMQRLAPGPLAALLPERAELWLDGGHNAAAADAARDAIVAIAAGRPLHLVLGMLANKDADTLVARFAPIVESLVTVPVPGHEHHDPQSLADHATQSGARRTAAAADIAAALAQIRAFSGSGHPPVVLILGSLYLAGTVLDANHELPD